MSGHTPEWHARRAQNIGSSEVAALFGVQAAYALSLYALHHVKAGNIAPPNLDDDKRVQMGTKLEAVIAEMAAVQEGWTLLPALYGTDGHGSGATLDYVIAQPGPNDEGFTGPGALEVKNTDRAVFYQSWTNGEPPPYVLLQLQHEMLCTGFTWGAIVSFVGGNEVRVFRYAADQRIHKAIRAKVAEFWRRVREGEEPDIDGSAATADALRKLHPDLANDSIDLRASNEWPIACADLLRLAEDRKRTKAEEDEAKNRVRLLLAGHKSGWGGGFSVSETVIAAKPDRPAVAGETIKGRAESRRLNIKEQVPA